MKYLELFWIWGIASRWDWMLKEEPDHDVTIVPKTKGHRNVVPGGKWMLTTEMQIFCF